MYEASLEWSDPLLSEKMLVWNVDKTQPRLLHHLNMAENSSLIHVYKSYLDNNNYDILYARLCE